ncbi:MAG TPA: hypothetical protein VIR27_15040 [Mycobacteriales bacterium]|jgi:hypothetical protein
MSSYKEQVGEWIRVRRDELQIPGRRLALLAGISYKTVTSAEAGRTEIRSNRAAVEDVLRWERGSLTRAYRHGEKPAERRLEHPSATPEPAHHQVLAGTTKQEAAVLLAVLSAIRQQYGQTGHPSQSATNYV